ncbi:MAG: tripartite tricarboxylate transporter permease [Kiritimatiellae bacterium]|nr:tripartite tricarboxylate transporter permease [Kiritimatiellia bacterium]MDD5520549.1 tripartite tricarboxylate transporter permease [Kiritimatiellia bacterium]
MILKIIISTITGSLISSVLTCIPGLHIYNVIGLMLIMLNIFTWPPEVIVPFFTGMIVGYAMLSTVPSVLLAAPDESALFIVLPGQKYLMYGRGYEGTMLTTFGGLAGLFLLLFVVGPIAPKLLPVARVVFQPHVHWILWCVICFMLMSEWPKGGTMGQGGLAKLWDSWKSTGAGLLTFVLSGLLGFILLYRSPISPAVAFQNLMPAFVGLFTIPWLILNIVSGVKIPKQRMTCSSGLTASSLLRGTFAGGLGGGFAAFFPVVSGGVGGFLSGHATALRDDRAFLISQGCSKLVYYVGGFLLLFVPGLGIARGGGAWLMRGLYVPGSYHDYYMALASIAIAGAVSFILIGPLTRGIILLMERFSYRYLSLVSMILIVAIVCFVTGLAGFAIMLVAGGIGLIPVLSGSRRMNCLAVILLPIACNMSGVGMKVAGWLKLL